MLTFHGKLEQIAMSSSANRIVLEMQAHKLVKNYLVSFRPIICKVIRKMFIFYKHKKNKRSESPSLNKPQTFQFSHREHKGKVVLTRL